MEQRDKLITLLKREERRVSTPLSPFLLLAAVARCATISRGTARLFRRACCSCQTELDYRQQQNCFDALHRFSPLNLLSRSEPTCVGGSVPKYFGLSMQSKYGEGGFRAECLYLYATKRVDGSVQLSAQRRGTGFLCSGRPLRSCRFAMWPELIFARLRRASSKRRNWNPASFVALARTGSVNGGTRAYPSRFAHLQRNLKLRGGWQASDRILRGKPPLPSTWQDQPRLSSVEPKPFQAQPNIIFGQRRVRRTVPLLSGGTGPGIKGFSELTEPVPTQILTQITLEHFTGGTRHEKAYVPPLPRPFALIGCCCRAIQSKQFRSGSTVNFLTTGDFSGLAPCCSAYSRSLNALLKISPSA